MKCAKCGKDMRPPAGMPVLGLSLGIRYEDVKVVPKETLKDWEDYAERQFGKYSVALLGLCCECILAMAGWNQEHK